jgi:hypothetical protein
VFLGNDEQGRKDIANPDFDAHCTSAAVMANEKYETFLERYRSGDKWAKKLRTMAKPDTFKPLYGGERGTPQQEKWYKEFQARYSGVYHTQEDWLTEVMQDGSLKLPWGMTFKWRTKMNSRGLLLDATTMRPLRPQVCNYPVQSLATAEIVPIAILRLWTRCREADLRVTFVNTIHDSVIAYVHKDDVEVYKTLCEQAFTTDVYEYLRMHYGIEFDVPLGCEVVVGDHWGEGEEHVYDDVNNWSGDHGKEERYGQ